jgi:MYXO-CTERM domain-containing protein
MAMLRSRPGAGRGRSDVGARRTRTVTALLAALLLSAIGPVLDERSTGAAGGAPNGATISLGTALPALPHGGGPAAAALPIRAAGVGPLVAPTVAPGALDWRNITGAVGAGPSPRTFAGLADDPHDGLVVLFGGANSSGVLGDTWVYAAGQWSQLHPSVAPSPRALVGMTFDPTDGYVVLFGGENASGVALNDTWRFVAGTWTPIAISLAPPPRAAAGMTFSSTEGAVLLFGGQDGPTYLSDTWEYAGGVWLPLTGPGPAARAFPQLGDDPLDGNAVLFGGVNATQQPLADTWILRQHAWQPLAEAVAPSARGGGGFAWDATDGLLLLVGGSNATAALADSWGFVSNNWTHLQPTHSPGPVVHGGMVGDSADRFVLLVGGDGAPFGGRLRGTIWGFAAGLAAQPTVDRSALDAAEGGAFRAELAGGIAPLALRWSFGDGTTDAGRNVTHSFPTAGQYTVALNVTDLSGASAGGSITISVVEALVVGFTARPNPADVASTITFSPATSGGAGPYAYRWSFGDGARSTLAAPQHAFAAVGNYTVTLNVTDGHNATVGASEVVAVVTAGPGTSSPGYPPGVVYSVAAAAALGILAAVLLWRRRRRRSAPGRGPDGAIAPPGPPPAG